MIESHKAPVAEAATQEPLHSSTPHALRDWILRRPIPVWILFAWATLQLLGVLAAMKNAHYLDAITEGFVSPVHALAGFAYPFLFFLGGVLLLFLRRAAVLMYGAYLVWGIARILAGGQWPEYLSLAIVAGICVYCWQLIVRGTLR